MDSCFFCGKEFTEAGYIIKHGDRYFCDELCLAKQLYEDADGNGEVEAIWFDTPENIEICEKERWAEW